MAETGLCHALLLLVNLQKSTKIFNRSIGKSYVDLISSSSRTRVLDVSLLPTVRPIWQRGSAAGVASARPPVAQTGRLSPCSTFGSL